MDLDAAIRKLEGVRNRARDMAGFYRAHATGWLELARRVAMQTLLVLKPETADTDRWKEQVAAMMEKMAVALVESERTGVMIWLADDEQVKPRRGGYRNVASFATVVAWVEAGRRNEPLGKRLTEIDDGLTDRQIAWRVFNALRRGVSHGLAAAVDRFATLGGIGEVGELGAAVEQAWGEVFEVRVREDFRRWLAE